ncbi:hypothetical protein Y032_0107g3817 [Ancylostoma ceylanicum]|uniref:Uncharacterized protein n=1 Tax=Ancylostoma ceylanicum TaxID=53326 RepID=A0A016TFS2_9BILA|nr:hypothetical protein Y032_0107g3817 [Ancylostoma ceylanicum]
MSSKRRRISKSLQWRRVTKVLQRQYRLPVLETDSIDIKLTQPSSPSHHTTRHQIRSTLVFDANRLRRL